MKKIIVILLMSAIAFSANAGHNGTIHPVSQEHHAYHEYLIQIKHEHKRKHEIEASEKTKNPKTKKNKTANQRPRIKNNTVFKG